ncbi:hypothetical protein BH10ACI3_BH10ACI3_28430 [soil metagenome]
MIVQDMRLEWAYLPEIGLNMLPFRKKRAFYPNFRRFGDILRDLSILSDFFADNG